MEDMFIPPVRKDREKSKLKKIITFFTCVVLVFVSIALYFFSNFAYGYKYYQTLDNDSICIGQTASENFLDEVLNEKLNELENNGYLPITCTVKPEILIQHTFVKKEELNNEDLRQKILDSFTIDVLLTKLTVVGEDKTYYFKTEEECNTFVNELNKISKVETAIEGVTGTYTSVTDKEGLNSLIAKLEAKEKQKKEEQLRVAKITSRGGVTRDTKHYNAPMASYVYISSKYGPRGSGYHTGVDFAAPQGTAIYAWKGGTVLTASWNGSYGNFIEIKHPDNTISRYAHLSKYGCHVGETVTQGQVIGYVGSTGNSTGPHLHFEIKVNGSFVNPLNYL